MGFFWKYTRNGKISKTYQSFVIDVLPNSLTTQNNQIIWHTSFEELEAFLILLQDIEVINNPQLGATKPAYSQYVRQLGYRPTLNYSVSGSSYICGQAIIGRHSGSPLPWGFFSNSQTPIDFDVTGIKTRYDLLINTVSNGNLLGYYSSHPEFQSNGNYWDYMPLHSCLVAVITLMNSVDPSRTDHFVRHVLCWQ